VRLSQQERKALVETGNGVRFRQSVTEVLVLGWERLGGNGKGAAQPAAAGERVAEPEEEPEVAEVPQEAPEPASEPEPEV
jgi:hypothetical protein